MNKVGSYIILSIPEFGIEHVPALVKTIKLNAFHPMIHGCSRILCRPVVGVFRRYVANVRIYTFRDKKGNIMHIKVTPDHPFYVKSKHGFIAIQDINDMDDVVSIIRNFSNSPVHIVCPYNRHAHCGALYHHGGKPILSYTLEIQDRHFYAVGRPGVLAHNSCNIELGKASPREVAEYVVSAINEKIPNSSTRLSLDSEGYPQDGIIETTINQYRDDKSLSHLDRGKKRLRRIVATVWKCHMLELIY